MLEQELGDSVHHPVCTTNLPACVYGRRTPGVRSSTAAVQGQSTTHARYPGGTLRFGEHGVLELLRDASLDHLLGRDFDGFPGCWVATGPRFALL